VDGTALVHSQRIILGRGKVTGAEKEAMDHLFSLVRNGARAKYIVSVNGALVVGLAEITNADTGASQKIGHPTLIGGTKKPHGRMGGELLFGVVDEGGGPEFYITNDSGRYSKHDDLTSAHLQKIADRFTEQGYPVRVKWIDLKSKKKKMKDMPDVAANNDRGKPLPSEV